MAQTLSLMFTGTPAGSDLSSTGNEWALCQQRVLTDPLAFQETCRIYYNIQNLTEISLVYSYFFAFYSAFLETWIRSEGESETKENCVEEQNPEAKGENPKENWEKAPKYQVKYKKYCLYSIKFGD